MKKLFCFLVMVFFFFLSIPTGDADMTRQLKGGYTKVQVDALLAAYCLESAFGDAPGTGLLLDGTTLKASTVLQIYHGISPSANVQSFLGAADYAAMRAQLEVHTLNISFVQNGMIATDDFLFGPPFKAACTVTDYGGVLHSGTNIIGRLYICNATTDITNPMDIAANCDACDSADITFDGGNDDREAAPDGVVAVGVGYRLAFVTNMVSAPGFFTFDVNLTVD